MRRIVHLSDLHFGRVSPELTGPLLAAVNGLRPDLVVVSGDFTQRARHWQFAEARDFLARIEAPVLAVPGNHDTPLDNLFLRMFRPWGRYRRYIGPELEPVFQDRDLHVVGVNTVNRFAWQQGRLSRRALARLLAAFGPDDGRMRIVVCHHPLEHLPGDGKALTRGAGRALAALGDAGADIVLCGHVHTLYHAPFTAAPGVLFVQAGTGLSDRLRAGQANSFNLLELADDQVQITALAAVLPAGAGASEVGFQPLDAARFRRDGAGWQRLTQA